MKNRFKEVLNSAKPFENLHEAAIAVRKQEVSKESILEALESLRSEVDEEAEDTILDVVDCLVGWCSPHLKID